MNETPTLGAAEIFYLVFAAAMIYFVFKSSLRAGTMKNARMRSALFGLVAAVDLA